MRDLLLLAIHLLVTLTKFLGPGEARQVVLPARSPNLNAYAERWVRRR